MLLCDIFSERNTIIEKGVLNHDVSGIPKYLGEFFYVEISISVSLSMDGYQPSFVNWNGRCSFPKKQFLKYSFDSSLCYEMFSFLHS